jgi:hypothetical protein
MAGHRQCRKKLVKKRTICCVLAFLSMVFCVSGANRNSAPRRLSDYDSFQQMLDSKKFNYYLGYWPDIRPKSGEERFRKESKDVRDWLKLQTTWLYEYLSWPASVIDTMNLESCKSTFYFVHFKTAYRPAKVACFAKPLKGPRYVLLDADSLAQSINYVCHDCLLRTCDSLAFLRQVYDVVTVTAGWWPLLILNSIDDVREFSNTVRDTWIWTQIEEDDSAAYAISSIRIADVSQNPYLTMNYARPRCDSTEFLPYRELVRPPLARVLDGGSCETTLYTWSPRGGELVEWKIRAGRVQGLQVERKTLTRRLGFYFSYI